MSKVAESRVNKVYLWMICLVATLGGFLFGYDWVVVGGAKEFYEAHFGIYGDGMESLKGWGTSSALIGCIVGAVVCSFVSDRLGRKRLLILAGILFAVSAVGTLAWREVSRHTTGIVSLVDLEWGSRSTCHPCTSLR